MAGLQDPCGLGRVATTHVCQERALSLSEGQLKGSAAVWGVGRSVLVSRLGRGVKGTEGLMCSRVQCKYSHQCPQAINGLTSG